MEVTVRRGDADDPLAGVIRLDLKGSQPVDVVVLAGTDAERIRAEVARALGRLPVRCQRMWRALQGQSAGD